MASDTLAEAGRRYREAKRLHSEAFLRYKALDDKRTDGVARAMADQDIDLAGAEVEWTLALERVRLQRSELLFEIVLLAAEGADATQSTTRSN